MEENISKSIFYRWFGLGKVPSKYEDIIRSETILFKEEGLSGFVTFRNFKAPGKRYGYRKNWFCGSIVLTRKTFLAFQFRTPLIGVNWNNDKIKQLDISVENENRLVVKFESTHFNPKWSGFIEVRFKIDSARELSEFIKQKISEQQVG